MRSRISRRSTYATERRQGRAVGAPAGASSPIIEHADVRRMLLTMRSTVEAMRGLVYANAEGIDLARHAGDEDARVAAQELVDLLTPVTKAWCTDMGTELASLAVQVHGGMGYIEETGVAQRYRDIRIAAIYEGTNGIQAMDLVGRKLPMRAGGVVEDFLQRLEAIDPGLGRCLSEGGGGAARGDDVDPHERRRRSEQRARRGDALPAHVRNRCRWLGHGPAGDRGAHAGVDDPFNAAKLETARFYIEELLPQVHGLMGAITAGSDLSVRADAGAAQLESSLRSRPNASGRRGRRSCRGSCDASRAA